MTKAAAAGTAGDFQYRFERIEFRDSLKFVGCEKADTISEFEAWENFDKSLIHHKIEPMIGIHLWQNETNPNGAWTLGCLVESIEALPRGAVGVDTGWKKFMRLTVRRNTVSEIYESTTHYRWAHNDSWDFLPISKQELSPYAPGASRGFSTKNHASTSLIEIYPAELADDVPEMCFYYPLKESKI